MKDNKKYENNRYFLKDTIRMHIDFSRTDQSCRLPAPALQKLYPDNSVLINLPEGAAALKKAAVMPLGEAVLDRQSVRKYSSREFSVEELSALLFAAQGVRRVISPACALRTVPSAGARHAFETYIAVSRVNGIAAGLYRYLPLEQKLLQIQLDSDIGIKAASACLEQDFVSEAGAVFFWTAIPARMEWRYDMAAHKVIAVDAGHVCQNLYLAAQSIGAGVCAIAAYNQAACDSLLIVDGEEEFTVYIASAGKK